MKHILFLTLLTVLSNVFVFGKGPTDVFRLGKDTVVVLGPDNMPCVKPSLTAVERMPVKKLDNTLVRPMPNGARPWGPGYGLHSIPMPGPKLELAPQKKRKWQ